LAVAGGAVSGHRLAQHTHPLAGRVLVEPVGDRGPGGLEHCRWAVGVGEALAQVHGAVRHGQRRHLGEDGRRERLQPGYQPVGADVGGHDGHDAPVVDPHPAGDDVPGRM